MCQSLLATLPCQAAAWEERLRIRDIRRRTHPVPFRRGRRRCCLPRPNMHARAEGGSEKNQDSTPCDQAKQHAGGRTHQGGKRAFGVASRADEGEEDRGPHDPEAHRTDPAIQETAAQNGSRHCTQNRAPERAAFHDVGADVGAQQRLVVHPAEKEIRRYADHRAGNRRKQLATEPTRQPAVRLQFIHLPLAARQSLRSLATSWIALHGICSTASAQEARKLPSGCDGCQGKSWEGYVVESWAANTRGFTAKAQRHEGRQTVAARRDAFDPSWSRSQNVGRCCDSQAAQGSSGGSRIGSKSSPGCVLTRELSHLMPNAGRRRVLNPCRHPGSKNRPLRRRTAARDAIPPQFLLQRGWGNTFIHFPTQCVKIAAQAALAPLEGHGGLAPGLGLCRGGGLVDPSLKLRDVNGRRHQLCQRIAGCRPPHAYVLPPRALGRDVVRIVRANQVEAADPRFAVLPHRALDVSVVWSAACPVVFVGPVDDCDCCCRLR